MLELLGTVGGNVLSLPGILGLAVGMMTRNLLLAAVLGALIGVAESMIFAGFSVANIEMLELVVSIVIGILAACVGCAIRLRGATV